MLRKIYLLTCVLSLSGISVVAQNQSVACIRGNLLTAGRPASNVSIIVKNSIAGVMRSSKSDDRGGFQFCDLPPGHYQVTAQGNGLVSDLQAEDLEPGSTVFLRIILSSKTASVAPEPSRLAGRNKMINAEDGVDISQPERVQEVRLVSNFIPDASIPNAPSPAKQNQPHGLFYGYLCSSLANQADVTRGAQLPLSQFGGAIGGDLAHGRTSYFVSFDEYGLDRQRLLSNLAGQLAVGSTALLADANVLASSAFVGRVDHQFSRRDSAHLRFDRNEMHGNSLMPGRDAGLPSFSKGLNVQQQDIAVGNTLSLSPNTTNESTARFSSTEVQVPAGLGALGLVAMLPTARRSRVFQAADNIYRQVGAQNIRLGGDFLYNQMNISFLQASLGRIAVGGPSLSQSDRNTGMYVQSQRQLRPNLLVTTGIRYDVQALRSIKTDLNNFSPQVGFAWSPNSSRTVIRGGFGMYYDRVPLPAFAGSRDPATAAHLTNSVAVRNLKTGSLADFGSFTTVSPMMQNSYAEHASLQAEQQIGNRSVLSGQYEYVRGVQLALPMQRTAALCASTNVCNSANEFTGQQVGSGAVSSYSGFSVAFTQQPVRWGNYKVSYTYSNAENSGIGDNTSYINDQMRRVTFTGVLHTSLDPGSTLWRHLTHGFLLAGTSDYTNRSEFVGMNFLDFNARLSKNLLVGPKFRLEGMVETFNSFRRINTAFTNAADELGENASEIFSTYKRVATLQNPNGSQMGLRMTF